MVTPIDLKTAYKQSDQCRKMKDGHNGGPHQQGKEQWEGDFGNCNLCHQFLVAGRH